MNLYNKNIGKVFILLFLILIPLICIFIKSATTYAFSKNEDIYYIYLDPGHGGKDGGGVSKTGVYEKNINLLISYYLKIYLENSGYNVKLTRYGDYDLSSYNSKNRKTEDITKRVELINSENVLLFISIHCNIYTSEAIKGAQTFYNSNNNESKILAEKIQNKLKAILKNTDRESKSISGKYLIDNSIKTGCLVEVGFLSNNNELNLLTKSTYQEQVAYAIYIGIIDYLGI